MKKLLLLLPLVGFVVAFGAGCMLLVNHGAGNKVHVIPINHQDITQARVLRRVKPECSAMSVKLCKEEMYRYFNNNTCTCEACCFTREDQLFDERYTHTDCIKKNQHCDKWAIWSRCSRSNLITWPEDSTPLSSVCSSGKNPTKLPPDESDSTPGPIQAPTINPTTREAVSTPEAVHDQTDLVTSTNPSTNAPNNEPITYWTKERIKAFTIIGSIVVCSLIVLFLVSIVCLKPYLQKTRSNSLSTNNGPDTVHPGDSEALLQPEGSSQASASHISEPPSDHSVAEITPSSSFISTASEVLLKGDNYTDDQNRKDSGIDSGGSGQSTPQKTPKDLYPALTNICSTFKYEVANKHDDAAKELSSMPDAFMMMTTKVEDDKMYDLLKYMRDCSSCHPQEKSAEFVEAVEKMMKMNIICANSSRKSLSGSGDSLDSQDFLSPEEGKDVIRFLDILKTHEDFPHTALKDDLDTVKEIVSNPNSNTELSTELDSYTMLKELASRQDKIECRQNKQECDVKDLKCRQGKYECRQNNMECKQDQQDCRQDSMELQNGMIKEDVMDLKCRQDQQDCRQDKLELGQESTNDRLAELIKQPCLESDKIEIEELLKNKDGECKATFTELLAEEELMVEVTKLCDAEGNGEQMTKTLADLLNCEVEYDYYAYHRSLRLSVIENILEERENTSFFVLLACAYHFGMEGLIKILAGWHQDCPACKGLYRS